MQSGELIENRITLLRNKNIQLLQENGDLLQRNIQLIGDKNQLLNENEILNNMTTNLRTKNKTLTNQDMNHIQTTEAQNILIQKYLNEIQHYKNNNPWLTKYKKIKNFELMLMNMFAIVTIIYIYSLFNTQFIIVNY